MRFVPLTVWALTLVICLDAAAIPPKHDEPGAQPAEAPPAPKLTIQPANISINQSINYDLAGNVNNTNSQMSINVYCFYSADLTPLAYHDLSLEKVVTASGEELSIDPNRMNRGSQRIWANRQRNGIPYFQIYFNLPAPSQPTRGIRQIRGKLVLEMPDGPMCQIRLSPVSEFMGKRARIVDMHRRELCLEVDQEDGRFRLAYDQPLEPLIQEISFVKADGSPLQIDDNGGGSNGSQAYKRFRGQLPDDAAVVIKLYRDTRDVEVPFALNDLPLPGQDQPGRQPEVAVATEPLGTVEPGAGGPQPLKVELIDAAAVQQ